MLFTCSYVFDSDSADVFTNVRPVSHFMTLFYTHCMLLLSLTPALPSRRPSAQTHAKTPSGRAVHSSAKPMCKTEPGMENPAGEQPVDSELLCFSVGAFLTRRPNHADTQEPKTSGQSLFVLYRTCKNIWEHVSLVIDSLWGETSGFCRFWLIIMLPNN